MKLSGFTFVKNAIKYAYPLKESIYSVLPLVDEFIIAAGDSDDGTTELIKSWNEPKIKIIETIWDKSRNVDGWIYADQTNIALRACTGDWCFYIQADEVINELDFRLIKSEIESANKNQEIEALLFRYIHFYGSYEFVGIGRQWYRREIRLIKNIPNIVSWGDAQGFRYKLKDDNVRKLNAKQIEAKIYHYGWVRPPKVQGMKLKNIEQYYHAKEQGQLEEQVIEFDYQDVYELKKFEDKHPQIMLERIEKDYSWTKFFIPKPKSKPLKHKITDSIEKATGWRIGEYKDFIEVK
ncbi:MAG: glycosyltransferase family 2 protein [Candidatus Kapabacteria bacterium]|nr:glycosyltransferase family 2 protein [Candidatus Kapabacteria bacterium]